MKPEEFALGMWRNWDTAILGSGIINIMIAIGIVYTPGFFRIVRSQVLYVGKSEYVEGAITIGLSHREIILRYILPNVVSPIIVQASLCRPGNYRRSLAQLPRRGNAAAKRQLGLYAQDGILIPAKSAMVKYLSWFGHSTACPFSQFSGGWAEGCPGRQAS